MENQLEKNMENDMETGFYMEKRMENEVETRFIERI